MPCDRSGAAPPDRNQPARPYRYIYNCDADNMFIYHQPPMQPEDVYPYIDQVAAAGVTSFFMSVNDGMVMNFPSRHARMLGDEDDPALLEQIEETGREPVERDTLYRRVERDGAGFRRYFASC